MSEFWESLRAEILAAQQRRGELTKQKFTYVIASFGLGTLSAKGLPTSGLIFIAPVIAFAFDLYMVGEDYGIKRAGAFLCKEASGSPDALKEWERWVSQFRDPFSKYAGPFLSAVVLAASASFLWKTYYGKPLFAAWGILNAIMIIGVAVSQHVLNNKVMESEKGAVTRRKF